MTYVYILSDYDEHGAEHVTATLDRAHLAQLVDSNWPLAGPPWNERAKAGLARVLSRPDSELAASTSGWNCCEGWGGMQLHVVELK